MMFLTARAIAYATLFVGFVLIALPARLATASGLTSPATIGWPQLLGVLLTVAGGIITVACVAAFVAIGRGTPAPFDPPQRLVDRGPYAIVRNPMYVGAVLGISGAGLFYGSWVLFAYAAVFLGAMQLFILTYEEPALRRTFGDAYENYCRRVGRWCPAALHFALALTVSTAVASAQEWRDPSPHQVRRVTVDSSVQLEVLDWGGSGPPVVLLACYVSTHVYDEFAPKLTHQFRVYGVTRRGIGASDKPADGYAVQRSANDVLEVLNALKLQKSILVGHS